MAAHSVNVWLVSTSGKLHVIRSLTHILRRLSSQAACICSCAYFLLGKRILYCVQPFPCHRCCHMRATHYHNSLPALPDVSGVPRGKTDAGVCTSHSRGKASWGLFLTVCCLRTQGCCWQPPLGTKTGSAWGQLSRPVVRKDILIPL